MIDVDADVGALGRELVGRHHVVDQRLDEGRLLEIEEGVAGGDGRLRGGRPCCACAASGSVAVAAAAPPTTAPFRKSRRPRDCSLTGLSPSALSIRALLAMHSSPLLGFCASRIGFVPGCAIRFASARRVVMVGSCGRVAHEAVGAVPGFAFRHAGRDRSRVTKRRMLDDPALASGRHTAHSFVAIAAINRALRRKRDPR